MKSQKHSIFVVIPITSEMLADESFLLQIDSKASWVAERTLRQGAAVNSILSQEVTTARRAMVRDESEGYVALREGIDDPANTSALAYVVRFEYLLGDPT